MSLYFNLIKKNTAATQSSSVTPSALNKAEKCYRIGYALLHFKKAFPI